MGAFDSVTKKISSLVGITSKGQATAANSLPVVLPTAQDALGYASGWQDDGTESGFVRVDAITGPLVRVSFRPSQYVTGTGGSANVNIGANLDSNEGGIPAAVTLVTTAVIGDYAYWRTQFYGRRVGIPVRISSTTPDFQVTVDGIAYGLSNLAPLYGSQAAGILEGWGLLLVPALFDDGTHDIEIRLVGDTTGAKSLTFFGLLLESRVGYTATERVEDAVTPVTLTTSPVEIPSNRGGTGIALRHISGVMYLNSSASDVVVTIAFGGTDVRKVTVPASGSADWLPPGGRIYPSASWTQKAATGAVITATTIGGW